MQDQGFFAHLKRFRGSGFKGQRVSWSVDKIRFDIVDVSVVFWVEGTHRACLGAGDEFLVRRV